ncbi:GAGA binding protein-like [Salvia divinorum]|uniref:GAGA-binding transcriptional activator n=1 Tax=Salvia divinorum TaxID=28513 RepID=A0ABD1IJL1_SALDI
MGQTKHGVIDLDLLQLFELLHSHQIRSWRGKEGRLQLQWTISRTMGGKDDDTCKVFDEWSDIFKNKLKHVMNRGEKAGFQAVVTPLPCCTAKTTNGVNRRRRSRKMREEIEAAATVQRRLMSKGKNLKELFTHKSVDFMDDDSLRNWGYYEPPLKGLGLQLMSPLAERDTKPFLTGRDNPVMVSANGSFHPRDCVVAEPPVTHMDYVRDSWINHREKFLHMFPGNPYSSVLPESSISHHQMQMVQQPPPQQQPETAKDTRTSIEEPVVKKEGAPAKKRGAAATPKTPKAKKTRKNPAPKENGNGIPIPVCSCTGTPQQCYRWGCGGWQSACCTTTISMYPLPMSQKRRGARIAGRKMSQGAFKKVLEKLATDGYNFANPIDLRTYWAKHGTNKFVIIR